MARNYDATNRTEPFERVQSVLIESTDLANIWNITVKQRKALLDDSGKYHYVTDHAEEIWQAQINVLDNTSIPIYSNTNGQPIPPYVTSKMQAFAAFILCYTMSN